MLPPLTGAYFARIPPLSRGARRPLPELYSPPELPNDAAAVEAAKQLIDGHDIELWQLDRKVAVISRNKIVEERVSTPHAWRRCIEARKRPRRA